MNKLWKSKWFKPIALAALAIAVIGVVLALPKEEADTNAVDNIVIHTPEDTTIADIQKDEEYANLDGSVVDGADIVETNASVDDDYVETCETEGETAEDEDYVEDTTEEIALDLNTDDSNKDSGNGETDATEESVTDSNTNNSGEDGENDESDDSVESDVDPDSIATYKDPDHEEEDPPEIVGAKWVDGVAVPMTVAEVAEFERQIYACKTEEEFNALMDTVVYFNVGLDVTKFLWYEGE